MIDKKMQSFINLRKVNSMMDWDDIKVGETYHLPPLVYNKRMDFVVVEKKENSMRVKKIGEGHSQTMFRTDITTKFIVKKWELHGSKA
jgi:hypothetical protein